MRCTNLTSEHLRQLFIHMPTSVGGECLYSIVNFSDMDGGDWTRVALAERVSQSKYKLHNLKIHKTFSSSYVILNNQRLYLRDFIKPF